MPADQPDVAAALDSVRRAVRTARSELRTGVALADVTFRFQQTVDAAARSIVDADFGGIRADLEEIAALDAHGTDALTIDDTVLERLADREWSPLGALESIRAMIRAVDVDRAEEAEPMLALATISVTEDMATSMRLHGAGWKSVYHHEILAYGLAPEDPKTMVTQRLRWAQGTIQVMLRENPLVQKGMTVAQRLMYWSTMWSYLSGFAALAYFAAPVIYLVFGILPVEAFSLDFFARLVPFLILSQLLFFVVGRGTPTWRGQQYSLALFPVWIRACWTAFLNVYFDKPLDFAVTPKTRQGGEGVPWYLFRQQLLVMALLVVAAVVGTVRLFLGDISVLGVTANLVWVVFDLLILSVVIGAARYRGPESEGDR